MDKLHHFPSIFQENGVPAVGAGGSREANGRT